MTIAMRAGAARAMAGAAGDGRGSDVAMGVGGPGRGRRAAWRGAGGEVGGRSEGRLFR